MAFSFKFNSVFDIIIKDGNNLQNRKKVVIYLYSIFFIIICSAFGVFDLVIGRIFIGTVLSFTSVMMILTVILNYKNYQNKAIHIIMATGIILFTSVYADGGLEKSGYLWLLTWPIIPFYFKGRKQGLIYNLVFFIFCIGISILGHFTRYVVKYDIGVLIIISAVIVTIVFFSYIFEQTIEENEMNLHATVDELVNVNKILQGKNFKILSDLQMSKEILNILMEYNCDKLNDLNIDVMHKSNVKIGESIYDIHSVNSQCVRVCLVDNLGKGVKAGLLSMVIKAEYDNIKSNDLSIEAIVSKLNELLLKSHRNTGIVFSCILIDFDLKKEEIRYCTAGLDYEFLCNNNIQKFKLTGPSVCQSEEGKWGVEKYSFLSQDKYIIYNKATSSLLKKYKINIAEFNSENAEMSLDEMCDSVFEIINRNNDVEISEEIGVLFVSISRM